MRQEICGYIEARTGAKSGGPAVVDDLMDAGNMTKKGEGKGDTSRQEFNGSN